MFGLAAVIVAGGFGLALLSNSGGFAPNAAGTSYTANPDYAREAVNGGSYVFGSTGGFPYAGNDLTQVVGGQTTMTMTASSASTYSTGPGYNNVTQGSPGGSGGLIEFSTQLSIQSATPVQTASSVAALAYSAGGYVAYQSTYTTSAYVVIRVPAAQYQQVLGQVMQMGTFLGETSNSNDVSVQYTDLNATLQSLRGEQIQLLKILNQTTSVNDTLAVESELQQVNQQINEVESQILQTNTLVDYATINVTISETPQQTPLSMTLSATPTNGSSPLSVTFNAIVKGGAQPYVLNYNFGDGTATQGQIVIHTYYQPGDYKVLVSATDQNGTVVTRTTTVEVSALPATSGVQGFLGYVGNLFLSVIEGIIEVAVVVLPLAAVGAAIVLPLQRRGKAPKSIKQSQ